MSEFNSFIERACHQSVHNKQVHEYMQTSWWTTYKAKTIEGKLA